MILVCSFRLAVRITYLIKQNLLEMYLLSNYIVSSSQYSMSHALHFFSPCHVESALGLMLYQHRPPPKPDGAQQAGVPLEFSVEGGGPALIPASVPPDWPHRCPHNEQVGTLICRS